MRPDNRGVMRSSRRLSLLFTLCACALGARAEQVYVIDQLLVGIHAEKNLDSPIIKVLPTGSVLEVLERDGDLARVSDGEDAEGWVDAAYLTSDEPAALRLAALEGEHAALEERLAELTSTAAAGAPAASPSGETPPQLDQLTRENTELKAKLSDERLRSGQLQGEVAQLRAELREQGAPPDARIVDLERTRERLERELARAEETVQELNTRASLEPTSAMVPLVWREYGTIILLLGLVLTGLAFGAGAYAIDALNRRRHGGFRI